MGRSNGSEKREGGGIGQEGRDKAERWDRELEDAGYEFVQAKKKKKNGRSSCNQCQMGRMGSD